MSDWNGEGIPHLGCKLDGVKSISSTDGIEWRGEATWLVVGHHINGKDFFVESIDGVGCIQKFSIESTSKIQFRPIKSARDKAINEMQEIFHCGKVFCVSGYDAGYRKVKPLTREEFGSRMLGYYDTYDKLVELGSIITE
jgi:hypothetical protein